MLTTLAYLRRDGSSLMMLRNKKPNDVRQGKWNGLGGRFEAGECFSGELDDCAEGELHWIEEGRLLDLELWPGDRIFLPWLDHPGFSSAKMTYVGGSLATHDVHFYSG